jgi:outer membrane protein assembly factor BamB
MILSRRLVVLGTVAIALASIALDRAAGQQKAETHSSIRFVEDVRYRQVMNVARDLIQDQAWNDAVKVLQIVLDDKEDRFVRVLERDPADAKKEIMRWRGIKAEANALLGALPGKGTQVYEATYGAAAREMLESARKLKDNAKIAEVAVRYRHTKAGIEAINILAKSAFPDAPKVDGWLSWRGDASNTAQADGNPPLLAKKLWSRPIMLDKLFDGGIEVDPDQPAEVRVFDALKQVRDLKQPVLPGFFPIASQGIMVYRSQRDVRAVALKTIKVRDPETGETYETLAGEMHWKTIPLMRSLSVLLEKNATRPKAESWLDYYHEVPGLNSMLYENTLIGTLTADGRYVYVIDDLSVPPPPGAFPPNPRLKAAELKPYLIQNELQAYNIMTGKLQWDTAGDERFKDSHFLSAPISVGGKLYVLNEKLLDPNANVMKPGGNPIGGDSELRLICIDPEKTGVKGAWRIPVLVEPNLTLGTVVAPGRMVEDLRRRVQAAPMAFADGILVCPTNAGEVFGIELPTRCLAWAYSYRDSAPEPIALPGVQLPKGVKGTTVLSKWKSAPPAIQDGKLVFTASDSDSIHCVSLRDGKAAWKAGHQKDDLYLAGVHAGRVLIVGSTRMRALDLKDGKPLWAIPTDDLPTGQGTASKGLYYLPLRKEILAIDIAKGEIKAHHAVPPGSAAPGNLVFYGDMLLSQSPTEVTAYPQANPKQP